MSRPKLELLLAELTSTITKVSRVTAEVVDAANEAAKSAATSWSAAGEREYTRQQADINQANLDRLNSLKAEIVAALTEPVPTIAKPPCFLSLKYDNGATAEIYLVTQPVILKTSWLDSPKRQAARLVSPDSPLGQALLDKSNRESFEYQTDAGSVKGTVLDLS